MVDIWHAVSYYMHLLTFRVDLNVSHEDVPVFQSPPLHPSTRSAPVCLGHNWGVMRGAQLFSYTYLYQSFIFFADMSLENFMALSSIYLLLIHPLSLPLKSFLKSQHLSPMRLGSRTTLSWSRLPIGHLTLHLHIFLRPQRIALFLSNLYETSKDATKMLWTFM